MKTSDLFNYQTEAMRLLNNSYEKDKLVHAYLLDGDKGSGTVDAAIYMAKKLICKSEEKPCNRTGSRSVGLERELWGSRPCGGWQR